MFFHLLKYRLSTNSCLEKRSENLHNIMCYDISKKVKMFFKKKGKKVFFCKWGEFKIDAYVYK